jgi:hypothetical protein
MKRSRAIGVVTALFSAVLLFACSTPDVAKPGAAIGGGKYYAVTKETPFYHYGPLQGNGPDQKLAQDTLVTVVRPSFGYSKVRLLNGEQGYLASEDIHVASPALVAAAFAPPPSSSASRFRLDVNDPRLIAPPPPLPADLPEPTPIPGTESTPVP